VVFSESSSLETKVAKQEALEQIVKDSYDYLKHSALETVVLQCHYSKTMNCLMQELGPRYKVMEKSG
jgi:glutamate racemase